MNQRTDDTMTKQKGKETNNGQQNACYTDNYPQQNLTQVFRNGKHFLHTTSGTRRVPVAIRK